MKEIIPDGTEVIVFFDPSNDSTSTRLESFRTFKGKIISSRESEDLSYMEVLGMKKYIQSKMKMVKDMKQHMGMPI